MGGCHVVVSSASWRRVFGNLPGSHIMVDQMVIFSFYMEFGIFLPRIMILCKLGFVGAVYRHAHGCPCHNGDSKGNEHFRQSK